MSAPRSSEPKQISDVKAFTLKCPTCKEQVIVSIPLSVKELEQGGLVNILIPDTQTKCGHAIQIFMDQNYKVRGYTRIDYVNRDMEVKVLGAPQVSTSFFKGNVDDNEGDTVPENVRRIRHEMAEAIKNFSAKVAGIKAIACFESDGTIFAKALTEEIKLEDISLVAASMIAQSTTIGKNLRLKLADFTITSETYKITVLKAGEVLVMLIYDKSTKEGYMKFEMKSLEAKIKAIGDACMLNSP